MASIEFITKKVENKRKEIEKLEKKLARIRKAEAGDWETDNPYGYREYDLKYTTRDLERAKEALEKLEADLATAVEKANSRNVKAILTFLDMWKERMKDIYLKTFEKYPEAYETFKKEYDENYLDYYDRRKLERENPEEYHKYSETMKALTEGFKFRFGFLAPYIGQEYPGIVHEGEVILSGGYYFDMSKFLKDINEEANRKYDNIIERTNHIVGTITDAEHLSVGEKGELDGYVTGDRGKAHVFTIGAGGWNIQCFHFRVLVHKA